MSITKDVGQKSDEHVHTHPCPICAAHLDPVTGNPRYNAETASAFDEDDELSGKRFNSFEEMWEDLNRDDPEDHLDD